MPEIELFIKDASKLRAMIQEGIDKIIEKRLSDQERGVNYAFAGDALAYAVAQALHEYPVPGLEEALRSKWRNWWAARRGNPSPLDEAVKVLHTCYNKAVDRMVFKPGVVQGKEFRSGGVTFRNQDWCYLSAALTDILLLCGEKGEELEDPCP